MIPGTPTRSGSAEIIAELNRNAEWTTSEIVTKVTIDGVDGSGELEMAKGKAWPAQAQPRSGSTPVDAGHGRVSSPTVGGAPAKFSVISPCVRSGYGNGIDFPLFFESQRSGKKAVADLEKVPGASGINVGLRGV